MDKIKDGGKPVVNGPSCFDHNYQTVPTLREAFLILPVNDFDAAAERLQTHAIELPWVIEESADSKWVKCYDPAGNLIELHTEPG